jgi:hypothetical protein
MDRGPIPPAWDENPTAWPKRLSLAARAFVGFAIAGYLTLYQFGVFPAVWDPFFLNGSPKVLGFTYPFPDAALGVLAYLTEIVLSFIGGQARWRTMPWASIALGFIVGFGAVVSVVLMIVQPVFVGAWCTLCLASAFVSFTVAGPGLAELLASLQHLRRVCAEGGPVWHSLWGLGGAGRKGS